MPQTPTEKLAQLCVDTLQAIAKAEASRRPEDRKLANNAERILRAMCKDILHPKQKQQRLFEVT